MDRVKDDAEKGRLPRLLFGTEQLHDVHAERLGDPVKGVRSWRRFPAQQRAERWS
jgi:hypothetical protein